MTRTHAMPTDPDPRELDRVLVCGHGRCGTSMLMKMLDDGGFPVLGSFPDYEPEEVGFDRNMASLLSKLSGRAAKIIDPQLSVWPPAIRAKVIWLDRDHKQQAKSQIKFLEAFTPGLVVPSEAWRSVAKSLGPDTLRSIDLFERSGCQILRLKFESVLKDPTEAASQISRFLGGLVDADKAARAVKRRSPQCAPGIDLELEGIREALQA